jgi:hypothetical protein
MAEEPKYLRGGYQSKGAEAILAGRACEVRPAAPSPAQMLGLPNALPP